MKKEEIRKLFLKNWKFGHPLFYELIWEICKLHEIKNKGYGGGNPLGNFYEPLRFGIDPYRGCLVRMSDKITRLYNLTKKMNDPQFKDAIEMESLEDTLKDLAVYSLIAIVLLKIKEK